VHLAYKFVVSISNSFVKVIGVASWDVDAFRKRYGW